MSDEQKQIALSVLDLAVIHDTIGYIVTHTFATSCSQALESWYGKPIASSLCHDARQDIVGMIERYLTLVNPGDVCVTFSPFVLMYIQAALHHMYACAENEREIHRSWLTYGDASRSAVARKILDHLAGEKPFALTAHDLGVLYETLDYLYAADSAEIEDWYESSAGNAFSTEDMRDRIVTMMGEAGTPPFSHLDLIYLDAAALYVAGLQNDSTFDNLPYMMYSSAKRTELCEKIRDYLKSQKIVEYPLKG